MKKILIFSITIAMLVCAGCGTTSNTAQKNKSTVATTETTEEVVYKDPITYTEYETLDALTADFPEKQPGITQYPVSYTHLDVYKRQLRNRPCSDQHPADRRSAGIPWRTVRRMPAAGRRTLP